MSNKADIPAWVIGVIKGMPEVKPVWTIKFEDDEEDDLR